MNATRTPDAALDVLVVDDIDASRQELVALTHALGHTVREVASGQQALHAVRERLPDLLLVDLLMPDMDGFALTHALRQQVSDRWLPVIVTSALDGDEHFALALSQGADDCLSRPVNPALLEAKLRHYQRVLAMQTRVAALAQRQRDILDNILDPVLTLDAHGRVRDMNQAACRLFSSGRPGAMLDQPCETVLGQPLLTLLDTPTLTLRRRDGAEFPAELGASQWREDGELRYTLVARDVTQQRQTERMKDEFLATVSHELRTPLTSVLGALGLLASGAAGALPPAANSLAEVARRNGQRLSRLIDDILDLTKLEGDRMVMRLRPVRVAQLLQEALSANQGYAARAEVTLRTEAEPALARAEVPLDADRFLQVMANLLSNAIKHSPAGREVTVSTRAVAGWLRIEVKDRGPGIPAEFRDRMFEKFSQADGSDRRAIGGTGLGLYISRMMVERMGGRVGVHSLPGQGATFWVEFPCDAAAQLAPARVLHVERDLDVRQRLADWLGEAAQVVGVDSLNAADARSGPWAWVVADPRGQEQAESFCQTLTQRAQGAPVLLYSDSVDADFAQQQGLRWLPKTGTSRQTLELALARVLHPSSTPATHPTGA